MTFRQLTWFIALGTAVFVASSRAGASLVLTLDHPAYTPHLLGGVETFTGTLTNTGPDYVNNITIASFNPYLYDAAGDSISFTKPLSFGLTANGGEEFGTLFTFNAPYSQPPGVYDSTEPSAYAEPDLYFTGTDIKTNQSIESNGIAYSVIIPGSPVPEPATLSFFGLGAVAVLMRRRV